jgi:DNA-binding YbaB/EbfC family protein
MDLNNLMQIANQMKDQLAKSQEEAAKLRITGEAGGGMVRVVLNGKHEAIEVSIDSQVLEGGDKGLAEDLLRAAFNQATAKVNEELRDRMGNLTQGLGIDFSQLGFPSGT